MHVTCDVSGLENRTKSLRKEKILSEEIQKEYNQRHRRVPHYSFSLTPQGKLVSVLHSGLLLSSCCNATGPA